jgi:hypothetical protein
MSVRDLIELEGRLQAHLPRLGPVPPHGLDEMMVKRAVAHRQKSRFGFEVPWANVLRAAGVAAAGVAAGLVLSVVPSTPQFAGPPDSPYAPPLQAACDEGRPAVLLPPESEVELPAGEDWGQRTEDCVEVGTGLPVADLTLGGWNYRCPDGSCWSAGTRTLLVILANLGPAYGGPTDVTLGGSGVPLRIEYQPTPYLEWRSNDGPEGRSTAVSIDLTLLAQGEGSAFALLSDGSAYGVPDDLAREILLTYFRPAS